MIFLAILIYMGVVELPSVEKYWAMETSCQPDVIKDVQAAEKGYPLQ